MLRHFAEHGTRMEVVFLIYSHNHGRREVHITDAVGDKPLYPSLVIKVSLM